MTREIIPATDRPEKLIDDKTVGFEHIQIIKVFDRSKMPAKNNEIIIYEGKIK